MVGGRGEKTQTLLSGSLCIETAGLGGKTRHLFTAGESKETSDETCLLNASSWSRCVM